MRRLQARLLICCILPSGSISPESLGRTFARVRSVSSYPQSRLQSCSRIQDPVLPLEIQYPVQDAASLVGFDIELVTSIIRRVEIKEHALDAIDAVNMGAELADLVLVKVFV